MKAFETLYFSSNNNELKLKRLKLVIMWRIISINLSSRAKVFDFDAKKMFSV